MRGAIHFRKLVVFNLLSGADLWLTWRLMRQGGGLIYECNPVASASLACFGWTGLVVFKATMVAFIGVVAVFISLSRPKTSGRILLFGCLVTACVVTYSCYLSHALALRPADVTAWEEAAQRDIDLERQLRQHQAYRHFVDQLRSDMLAGRCSLREAVDALERSSYSPHSVWLAAYQERYPSLSYREHLALHLVYHAIVPLNPDAVGKTQSTKQVLEQYQDAFGKPLPADLLDAKSSSIRLAAKKAS
jgi:hypothetical protein